LGRFGISLNKPVTNIVSRELFESMLLKNKVYSHVDISSDKVLVTYVSSLDSQIIQSHNLDIVDMVNKFKDNESETMNASSVVISAAVTAYARMYISQIKLNILANGGKIYYSDTDSIVTDVALPSETVSDTELGKLKLE